MFKYSDESQKRAEAVRDELAEKPIRKMKTPKVLAIIEQAGCTGCTACIQFCPVDCIELSPGPEFPDMYNVVEVDLDRCIGCKACEPACPWDTIHMISRDDAIETANSWTLRSVIHDKVADQGPFWLSEEEKEALLQESQTDVLEASENPTEEKTETEIAETSDETNEAPQS